MADIEMLVDTSDLVRARKEVRRWKQQNSDAFEVVNSRMRRFGQVSDVSFNQFGRAASRAQQKSKRFASVGLQQAGYQVGDFAVQVQGGTNALVAFGQQGSQLAGIFGPAGAIIGALIAIGTAVGNVAFESIKAANNIKPFKEAMDDLSSSLSEYRSMAEGAENTTADLAKKYGSVTEEVVLLQERLQSLSLRQLQLDAIAAANALTEFTGGGALLGGELNDIQVSFDTTIDRARDLKSQMEAIGEASDMQGRLDAIIALKESVESVTGGVENMDRKQLDFYRQVIDSESAYRELLNVVEFAGEEVEKLEGGQDALTGTVQTLETLWGNVRDRITEGVNAAGEMSNRAEDIQRVLSGKSGVGREDPVVFDPRDPRYDPIAAEAARVRKQTSIYKPPSASGEPSGASGGAAQAAQEVEKLNDSLSRNQQLLKDVGKTMSQSFGDALMSVVDGSKSAADAFKDMARQILKQAFEMMVIQPILNSIFGGGGNFMSALFSANGNAFAQGGKVTAYANGGVVNQPTGFQHSGGLGVMGEAGPEAIMPLKRGKNGKLGVQVEGGSQGNVTVQNHFHIAANGDESVKRIIAQEAPRIANLTQKQILDQRRRGGAMKATFG